MDTLFIFFVNRSFLNIVEKNRKPVFKITESLPVPYINLKWSAKFQINWLHIHDSDWLNFISQEHDQVSIDIKKKRGSSINLDIYLSKVFSSGHRPFLNSFELTQICWPDRFSRFYSYGIQSTEPYILGCPTKNDLAFIQKSSTISKFSR